MTVKKIKTPKFERCPDCDGHGVVPEYGVLAEDFFGPKDCPYCKGTGRIKVRKTNERFRD